MRPTFFARRALPLLCLVFFLVPFGLRGARWSLQRMKNDVKDWLPASFKETSELEWFGSHFVGERFILATWPGCSDDDQRFHLMVDKIRQEIPQTKEAFESELKHLDRPTALRLREDFRARQMGDRLGLWSTGNYYENWGARNEKWLRGKRYWYFITPDGHLYQWTGGSNILGFAWRSLQELFGVKKATGKLVAKLGEHANLGEANRFYEKPWKLTARFFGSVTTGPEVLDRLAREGGPLWSRGDVADEDKPRIAHQLAMERLTGSLFGPAVSNGFGWTAAELREQFSPQRLEQLPAGWEETADAWIAQLVADQYGGDRAQLLAATEAEKTSHWNALFETLGVEPPARQTCMIITLSEVGKQELSRVVGRPLLGKPKGRLLALAEECNISTDDANGELKLGGPPVDNVAIDEEGTITLVRLVGFSVVLGVTLSFFCFRSFLVTIMVFLVGGISAVASLSIVYWTGASVDAVLMSMPSLVYVLGLSGAVHIVNYYRDAVEEDGLEGAPERALSHGWGPCTLAACTTALGLMSLYTSNILPIRKFGLYSALGVIATLALLFAYLPAALQLWPPGYEKMRGTGNGGPGRLHEWVIKFWDRVGQFVIRHYGWVATGCLIVVLVTAAGLLRINTSVQLLKLFDGDAKIIRDYRWLESNLGELVPMELVIRVKPDMILAATDQRGNEAEDPEDAFRYTLLERLEMADRVQKAVHAEFGPSGRDILGRGMSAATFAPDPPGPSASTGFFNSTARTRAVINAKLEDSYQELLATDYLRLESTSSDRGSELWRVSLRLGALNDVDYGEFVHELKNAVEPIMSAYRFRDQILRGISQQRSGGGFAKAQVVILGAADPAEPIPDESAIAEQPVAATASRPQPIEQTRIFAKTLNDLLINAGCDGDYRPIWIDPERESLQDSFATREELAAALENDVDCVVALREHKDYDLDFIANHAPVFVDARAHRYHHVKEQDLIERTFAVFQRKAATHTDVTSMTAAERNQPVHVIYTGVVPVVYKAQRTLLVSLMNSIGWAFVMIALVMMLLLRSGSFGLLSMMNVRGGLLSMAPNVFPVVLIFGIMGHRGILVDIGSMMTASVAMGVAVDDTIHFLSWFRSGIRQGLDRTAAIRLAYRRVATAMTQTTLIGGVGLSVFAVSTFTPTQRFGILMLTLLAAALIGDLIFLPAILASPLGKYFCPRQRPRQKPPSDGDQPHRSGPEPALLSREQAASTPHSGGKSETARVIVRRDKAH